MLAVGTCTASLLHRATVLNLIQECHNRLSSLASETLLVSSRSLNETEVMLTDAVTMWWLLVVLFLCFLLVVDSKALAAV